MTTRRFLLAVLAVIPMLALVGCGENAGTPQPDSQPSGNLKVGGKAAGSGRPAPPAPPPIAPIDK